MTYGPARTAIALLTLLAGTASADVTLIHAGQLLAVPGKAPASNMTIIVEDDRITGVQKGFVEAEDADGHRPARQIRTAGSHGYARTPPGTARTAKRPGQAEDVGPTHADAQHLLRDEHL